MPSPWHDTPNDLFKDDIAATAEIVRLAGVDLPAGTRLWLGPNVFNTRPAKEFIADTVILAGSPGRSPGPSSSRRRRSQARTSG
jgi:hypothetical protein